METGENPGFWENRAVVVGRARTREFRDRCFYAELEIIGVGYADVYVPASIVLSNRASMSNPAAIAQPQVGETYVLCVEPDGECWKIPECATPLFGTGYAGKKLEGDYEAELKAMLGEIRDVRRGIARSPVALLLEGAGDEPRE